MNNEELVSMLPWWRGFKGEIKKVTDHKFDVTGVVRKVNDTTIEITELPIHKWTQSFKAELEVMMGEKGEGVVKASLSSSNQLVSLTRLYRTTKNITTMSASISLSA
jgi:hypothetical protein